MEEELRRKAEVLTKLAYTTWFALDFGAAIEHSQEALKLHQKLGDRANAAMMHAYGRSTLTVCDRLDCIVIE